MCRLVRFVIWKINYCYIFCYSNILTLSCWNTVYFIKFHVCLAWLHSASISQLCELNNLSVSRYIIAITRIIWSTRYTICIYKGFNLLRFCHDLLIIAKKDFWHKNRHLPYWLESKLYSIRCDEITSLRTTYFLLVHIPFCNAGKLNIPPKDLPRNAYCVHSYLRQLMALGAE